MRSGFLWNNLYVGVFQGKIVILGFRVCSIAKMRGEYKKRIVCQGLVWGCASWEHELECKNSHTAHTWKVSLLNVSECAFWGSQVVLKFCYTVCNRKVFLPYGLPCASWDHKLVCRSSCTVCTWKAFFLHGLVRVSWGYQLVCRSNCTANKRLLSWMCLNVHFEVPSMCESFGTLCAIESFFSRMG